MSVNPYDAGRKLRTSPMILGIFDQPHAEFAAGSQNTSLQFTVRSLQAPCNLTCLIQIISLSWFQAVIVCLDGKH